MNRVETSQGSTRSWFNCDTGVFVSKTASSDLRVERAQFVPKLAGWIPPNEVVQLVVDDQVRGTPKDDGKHSGQMSRRFVPKHEFSPRDQRSPFGPKAGLFGEFPNCCVVRRLSDFERPSRQLPLLSSDVEIDEHLLVPSNYDKGQAGDPAPLRPSNEVSSSRANDTRLPPRLSYIGSSISAETAPLVARGHFVGAPGFEPGTSWSQTRRANQAALRPVRTIVTHPLK